MTHIPFSQDMYNENLEPILIAISPGPHISSVLILPWALGADDG